MNSQYVTDSEFRGLPVVAFEQVAERFPPGEVEMLLPISFRRINHVRAECVAIAKEAGYELISYVQLEGHHLSGV